MQCTRPLSDEHDAAFYSLHAEGSRCHNRFCRYCWASYLTSSATRGVCVMPLPGCALDVAEVLDMNAALAEARRGSVPAGVVRIAPSVRRSH